MCTSLSREILICVCCGVLLFAELKDDWDAIAQRVGTTRSAAECLIKFLSLPLLKQGSAKKGPAPGIASGFPLNELLTQVDSRGKQITSTPYRTRWFCAPHLTPN